MLVFVLFVARPGASRLKARIAGSIGTALQRQVEIGSVHVRLLPRPGFELENFVVRDDPSFSAEPVLRAEEVSALLRLSSLLHGRLEISQLSLTEPSLNLTRNSDGRWNIENLLERTSSTTVAPTAKSSHESRPGFPYIEADRGRINFKLGAEKTPFALTEADYSFWQDSENTWGMRLKARPMRTDFNLSDTGKINVSGTWQRASSLRQTPLQFSVRWDGAQLGQVTKFFSGRDKGWRGTITVSADLAGTPGDLIVHSDGSLEDFRRYDILGGGELTLHTHCDAHYSTVDRGLHQVFCQTPSGDGAIALLGDVINLPGPRQYDLKMAADRVPLQSVLALIRHAKRNLPDDLTATGTLAAELNLRGNAAEAQPELTGSGQTNELHLHSASTKADLAVGSVPFLITTAPTIPVRNGRMAGTLPTGPKSPALAVGPFSMKLGKPAPILVQARVSRSGYDIALNGEGDVQRILQVARTVGIPAANPPAEGSAKVDLHVSGEWAGFAGPHVTGTTQLHSVTAEIRGLEEPVEIVSANMNLSEDLVKVDSLSATAAGARWTGWITLPRMCTSLPSCPIDFNVHTDGVTTEALKNAFRPRPAQKKWYGFLSPETQASPPFLARIQAAGKVSATRMMIGPLAASHVIASIKIGSGKLDISELRADVLGGKQRGEFHADFGSKQPSYTLEGAMQGISLTQLAEAMQDGWISGTASVRYTLEAGGRGRSETPAASGSVDFTMQDGVLPHIALANGPLKVRRFAGRFTISDGVIEMPDATLESPAATYTVSGKASLTRELDFRLVQEGAGAIIVSGTIADPRVEITHRVETRAALKP
jgi:hypothetical protein